jgi:putative tryptophan/tyrosine transport system substrate-binding protein
MRRRDFLAAVGGATALSVGSVQAQQPNGVRRVAVLMALAQTDPEAQQRVDTFAQALQALGWTEGKNIQIDYWWSDGLPDRMKAAAAEIVQANPGAVLVTTTPAMVALATVTQTTPRVFVMVSDPVKLGFAASLSKPGKNITGFTPFEPSLGGKWVTLLREIAPGLRHVGILYNPDSAANAASFLPSLDAAASALGIRPTTLHVRDDAEIRAVVRKFAESDAGLIALPDPFLSVRREMVANEALSAKLPSIYPLRYFAAAGGLLSYGVNAIAQYKDAAAYVDRILRGASPSDLPIQAPSAFEMILNLKTANALGLSVPQLLLSQATEVIE